MAANAVQDGLMVGGAGLVAAGLLWLGNREWIRDLFLKRLAKNNAQGDGGDTGAGWPGFGGASDNAGGCSHGGGDGGACDGGGDGGGD